MDSIKIVKWNYNNDKEKSLYYKLVMKYLNQLFTYQKNVDPNFKLGETFSNDSEFKKIYKMNSIVYLLNNLDKDEIIGVSVVTPSEKFKKVYINELYVNKKNRGKGYGKLFLNLIIDKFKKDGYKRVNLSVLNKNNNAINLYKSVGFQTDTLYMGLDI